MTIRSLPTIVVPADVSDDLDFATKIHHCTSSVLYAQIQYATVRPHKTTAHWNTTEFIPWRSVVKSLSLGSHLRPSGQKICRNVRCLLPDKSKKASAVDPAIGASSDRPFNARPDDRRATLFGSSTSYYYHHTSQQGPGDNNQKQETAAFAC